jgi:hypothetical protein
MHQVLPSTLVERLFYHHRRDHAWGSLVDKRYHIDVDHIQSLDYMYYANGLVAVYRILQASFLFIHSSVHDDGLVVVLMSAHPL